MTHFSWGLTKSITGSNGQSATSNDIKDKGANSAVQHYWNRHNYAKKKDIQIMKWNNWLMPTTKHQNSTMEGVNERKNDCTSTENTIAG